MLKKSLIISFYISNSIAFATDVLIWEPNDEHKYGHTALQTKTYHMSLWPEDPIDDFRTEIEAYWTGVKGSLIFHEAYDNYSEGYYNYPKNAEKKFIKGRRPEKISLENIPARWINQQYEELLEFNDITPDRVTIDAGLEKINDKDIPSIPLTNTLYSYEGDVSSPKGFFRYKQSCTTFALNLISYGGLNIDDRDIKDYLKVRAVNSYKYKILTVPNFKNLVIKYSSIEPDSFYKEQIRIEKEGRHIGSKIEVKGTLKPKTVRKNF